MRLIDADDAINVFADRLFETQKTNIPFVTAEENQICFEICYKIAKHDIDNIQTTYDVDNIVEKLEKKTEFLKDCTKYGNESAEQQEKSYSTMMMYEVADLVDDLIDIVKQEINNGLE